MGGKQQYLGGYKEEEAAARAYDKAVIKIRGKEGDTNFPSSEYVDEMKRLRADELTVDEFILVLRDEAKKRSKQLKEEEEDRRIAMLKQLNEGGRSDALNEYLDMNRQQVPSSSTITGKRERGAGDVLSTLAAVSQGLVVGSKHQQQMNAEAILDSYLEMTRKAKRQKREQEKVALASHQSHHAKLKLGWGGSSAAHGSDAERRKFACGSAAEQPGSPGIGSATAKTRAPAARTKGEVHDEPQLNSTAPGKTSSSTTTTNNNYNYGWCCCCYYYV